MSLHVITTRSIGDTNLEDWSRVCDLAHDLLMDPDFLGAAESSLGAATPGARAAGCETHFWYLLAYEDDVPVGAACVTEYPLDTMVFASPLARWVVDHVRRWLPRYLKFRVTFCGLPISIAGSNLRIAPDAAAAGVVAALNEAVEQIARERRTWLVIYKELDGREATTLEPLKASGFVMAESLPMNRIVNTHGSFAGMLGAMRSHYRYKIARLRGKFAKSGLVLRRLTGPVAIREAYTPQLHAMYERVVLQAEHRLEILPREFFLELADRFPDELILTTISEGSRVLALAWSLRRGTVYRNLFVGIDHERNEETDAYFNLMVEDISHAMDGPADEILVGQTADDFKSRLGCTRDGRYLFIKVTNRFLRWWFLRMQSSFLSPPPAARPRNVFKAGTAEAGDECAAGREISEKARR